MMISTMVDEHLRSCAHLVCDIGISRQGGFTKALSVYFICLWCIFNLGHALAGDALQSSIHLQTEAGHKAVQSQKQVDRLFDEKQRLWHDFKHTLNELQSLQRYDHHLQKMVSAQEQKIIALEQQLETIGVTHREVIPLLLRMTETLARFVELDVPFLVDERRHRVKKLQDLLDLPDVSVAEKYRRVMEAYQLENEYGRTIEVYRGKLESAGRARTVDFLRIGRLALLYRALDRSDAGIWNPKQRSWQPLSDDYHSSLSRGFRIAKKQVAPDLLKLLVPAPEVVR